MSFQSSLFSRHLFKVQVVQTYSSSDMVTSWKNFNFILSERSDFYMVVNLSIAVHVLPMHMLTLLLVDEIVLPKYMNKSINFRGLAFNEEMTPSWLKRNSVLSEFMLRPITLAACSMLCSRDSTWASIFERINWLSVELASVIVSVRHCLLLVHKWVWLVIFEPMLW